MILRISGNGYVSISPKQYVIMVDLEKNINLEITNHDKMTIVKTNSKEYCFKAETLKIETIINLMN